MANRDALTGLAIRAKLMVAIERAFVGGRREDDGIALMAIDLDGFKAVNDSMGHSVGEALLQEVAKRLTRETRATDLVARPGGDEFAVLQETVGGGVGPASALAAQLLATIRDPFEICGHHIAIGASIGIALASEAGDTASGLIESSDFALYRAKSEGRNGFQFFEPAMGERARARQAIERDLRKAILCGELEVHYQTYFATASGVACGAEALVRWRRAESGFVGRDTFIPVAEEWGLIFPIGEWVLLAACRQAANWVPNLRISVNVSPVQFKRGDLTKVVRNCLALSGLAPERLELEMTESALIDVNDRNLAQLCAIKSLGVSIALDEFGTGFSSLGYLRKFPVDVITIDRSFIKDIGAPLASASTVKAVIALGRSLGPATVAEGVETPEQFAHLRQAGCSLVQGFMFSRPRPTAEVDFSALRLAADGLAPGAAFAKTAA